MHKFHHLPWTDRRLVVKSALLAAAIRPGLSLLSFQTLQRLLRRISEPKVVLAGADQDAISRVTWAVAAASRYIPGARCLAQALAIQVLLARRGHPDGLRIGVTKDEAGELQAHAGVERESGIVIGGAGDLARYTPLLPLEEDRS